MEERRREKEGCIYRERKIGNEEGGEEFYNNEKEFCDNINTSEGIFKSKQD